MQYLGHIYIEDMFIFIYSKFKFNLVPVFYLVNLYLWHPYRWSLEWLSTLVRESQLWQVSLLVLFYNTVSMTCWLQVPCICEPPISNLNSVHCHHTTSGVSWEWKAIWQFLIKDIGSILVCLHCCIKIPQTEWLEQTFLIILET